MHAHSIDILFISIAKQSTFFYSESASLFFTDKMRKIQSLSFRRKRKLSKSEEPTPILERKYDILQLLESSGGL